MATIFKQTKHIVLNSILLTLSVYLTHAQDTLPKCTAIDGIDDAHFGNGFNQISEGTTPQGGSICTAIPDYGLKCEGFLSTGYFYGYHDLSNYENNRFVFDSGALTFGGVRQYVTVSYDCVGTLQSPAAWIPLAVHSETPSVLHADTMLNRTFVLPPVCDNNANVGLRIDLLVAQFIAIKNMCINGEKTPTSAPTLNPSSIPTMSVSESPYESGQSEDASNSFSESGDRKKRKKRKKRGGSGSGSESADVDEALFAAHNDNDNDIDNEQMANNNNEYVLSLGFSSFSLVNIWLLFGVSAAINITVCFLCHKKREIQPVRDDSTIDF